MTDRYEALRKAAEAYEKEITSWHLAHFRITASPTAILELLAELDARAAQVEALKVDAERWRFGVSTKCFPEHCGHDDSMVEGFSWYMPDQFGPPAFKTAEEAIDAARAGKEG